MKSLFLIFALCLLITALAAAQKGQGKALGFHVYREGAMSRQKAERHEVIRTQAQFQKYWGEASFGEPSETPSDVDFTKEQLIVIHLGSRPTTDYSVVVDSVTLTKKTLTIALHEVKPHGMMVAHHVTSPFIIIKTKKTSGPVIFKVKSDKD